MTTLDPPSAAAAAICLTARVRVRGTDQAPVTGRHPGRCGWCDWTEAELERMLADFDEHDNAAHAFRGIHPDRARAMVTAAQAIPEPEPAAVSDPGHGVTGILTTADIDPAFIVERILVPEPVAEPLPPPEPTPAVVPEPTWFDEVPA